MKKYEMMFIVKPDLEEANIKNCSIYERFSTR